jgi:hypothetical protein
LNIQHLRARDGGICHLCDKPVSRSVATRDHIIPASKGGSDSADNIALAHRNCNMARGDLSAHVFRARVAAAGIVPTLTSLRQLRRIVHDLPEPGPRTRAARNEERTGRFIAAIDAVLDTSAA